MKKSLLLITVLFVFTGCDFLTADLETRIADLEGQLANEEANHAECRESLEVSNAGFNACILDSDTLRNERTELQVEVMNCKSKNIGLRVSLAEKADSISNITHRLQNKTSSYESLFDEHNKLLTENHVVNKNFVRQALIDLNAEIYTAEQSWHILNDTEEKTPQHLEAMKVVERNLNRHYGFRKAIGHLLDIQVETGMVTD